MKYAMILAAIAVGGVFSGCGDTTDVRTDEETTILSEVPDPEPARHSNVPVIPPPADEDDVIPPPPGQ